MHRDARAVSSTTKIASMMWSMISSARPYEDITVFEVSRPSTTALRMMTVMMNRSVLGSVTTFRSHSIC